MDGLEWPDLAEYDRRRDRRLSSTRHFVAGGSGWMTEGAVQGQLARNRTSNASWSMEADRILTEKTSGEDLGAPATR